jgi:class 3 adenylate cyclase/pimeloyl-ACP methyl ester carboxylesterase
MPPTLRYCTTPDGVGIAYSVAGSGAPLVVVPSWLSHLELDQQELVGPEFFDRLGSGFALVRYDKRGMGLSQRDLEDYSLDSQVADLHALIEHLALRGITLFGSSQGGAIAIAFTAAHPDLVARLILYGTYHSFPPEVQQKMAAVLPLVRADWTGLGTAPMLEMFVRGSSAETRAFFCRYQKDAANGSDAAKIMEALVSYDVSSLLSRIHVPTLVLHRRDDVAVSVQQSRDLVASIANAELVVLEGEIHLPYWGKTAPLLDAIGEFLGQERHLAAETSRLSIVLFTDLVGHTEMMQRLGDDRGREVLREHERITRDLLREHGGAEVKTMGDGFMASFGSVTRAMDCAIALQRAFAAHEGEPLEVRVGLNAGEPIEEDGDLFGSTVIMSSRIAAKAGAGEILIPEPLRHLLTGKSYVYADRGETMLKGFEDAVRLYEVRWRA